MPYFLFRNESETATPKIH